MQKTPHVIVVLGTGGTIAGLAADPTEHLRYRSAQLGVGELVAGAPLPHGRVLEAEQVAQLDSKDMDFATWRRLAQRIAHHVARAEVAGIVVTYGTDTLEETAYFLSRVVASTKPVVLTGAMRPASALEADGPRNLGDAIAVAGKGGPAGVTVVFAGEIHAARDVRKVHPWRLDAFSSGERGVLGRVEDGEIRMHRGGAAAGPTIGLEALPGDARAWPWVEIVTSGAGVDGRVVDLLVADGVDGIVVAATGNGTVHERLAAALDAAARNSVAVLCSSRCLDGVVAGGEAGAIPSAGDLTPVKARIELMLDLLSVARGSAPVG